MSTKVLIFGHAGFSGVYMTRYLQKISGIVLYGVDLQKNGFIEEYQADLTDFDRINQIISDIRPDYIINLAGLNQAEDPTQLFSANIIPVINTIRSLNANELIHTRLLLISSASVYGDPGAAPISESEPANPVNMYGASKLAMEQLLPVMTGPDTCSVMIARTFNLIGPGLSDKLSVPSFIHQLIDIQKSKFTPVIRVGNLHPRRDYIDIRDAVKAYWKIITQGKSGEIYNVGSGKSISMQEILRIILDNLGLEVTIETDKNRLRKNEILHSLADITKVSSLGWLPETDFINSITDMLDYYHKGEQIQ